MGEKRMENFALEQVRPEDRKGWISLAFVQMGMIICVPSLLLGCLLSLGMPLWKAIASGTAGYLLTVLLSFPLGMQGADLGSIYLWKKGSQISDRNSDAGFYGRLVWH